MSTSASSRPRTSADRSPPSSIANTIARSRCVASVARNASTSVAGNDSGSRLRLAHQPAAGAGTARTQMTQQPAFRAAQPLPPPRRRHRIVGALPGHHQVLEQRPHRRDPPVHRRRRRRTRPAAIRGAGSARPAHSLPVDPVEHQRRSTAASARSRSVRNRARFTTSNAYARTVAGLNPAPGQMRQERVRRVQPVPVAVQPIPAVDLPHPHRHRRPLPVNPCRSIHPPRPTGPDLTPQRGSCRPRAG